MQGTIFKINRGDRFSFSMTISDETQPSGVYDLQPNDILYFALLNPFDRFEDAIILRGYTYEDAIEIKAGSGDIHVFRIVLEREDTANLTPGVYYYTLKLQKNTKSIQAGLSEKNADITTIIDRTKFIINE